MQNIRDLTGQTFNHLTAIKCVGKDNQNKLLWLFKCDCGNEKVIRGTNVTTGHIKSCGCKKRGMNLKHNEKHRFYVTKLHGKKLRSKTDLYCNNKSGFTGVHKRKSDGRYSASICINRTHYQTTIKNFYDAVKWREIMLKAIFKLGE